MSGSKSKQARNEELQGFDDKTLVDLALEILPDNRFIADIYDFFYSREFITIKQRRAVMNTILQEEYR